MDYLSYYQSMNNKSKSTMQCIFLRSTLLFSVLFFHFSCSSPSDPDSTECTQNGCKPEKALDTDWVLTWSDEFDGSSIDASKWGYDTGYGPNNQGWGNWEHQCYTNSPNNAKVDNGTLKITAHKGENLYNCGNDWKDYSSARLVTKGKAVELMTVLKKNRKSTGISSVSGNNS